ncbi:hypothetical protein Pcinc_011439 [Petrolisthes cinctipes]|uniref:Transposase n=1 Tax=Petrolisthes cinctipes TaxID=88211 RepID=A0AAE1KTF8_PETCI|nr:hypothetical protein Pcinc_011439 [Petrolisthes cinctipes]
METPLISLNIRAIGTGRLPSWRCGWSYSTCQKHPSSGVVLPPSREIYFPECTACPLLSTPTAASSNPTSVMNMGSDKDLSQVTIVQIIALKKSDHTTKELAEQVGVSERNVRRWVAKFYREGGLVTPTQKTRPGKKLKTVIRAQTIVKPEVESNPRASARKIKESNRELFGEVLVPTVCQVLMAPLMGLLSPLKVLGVCDASLKFTNIAVNWPGSAHDSSIFNESRLCEALEEGRYRGFLLGDSGYAC